jgi:AcrR family transcriptional regulator
MSQVTEVDKREQIKMAARELFFRFGFNKTSMNDIAAQCHLAKPTLYYYYKSKEEIFDEIVYDDAKALLDCIESKMPKGLQADEKLLYFFEQIYQAKKEFVKKLTDCPAYLLQYSPAGTPMVEKIRVMFLEKLIALLEEGKKSGLFEVEDVAITAEAIVLSREFSHMDWLVKGDEEKRDKIMKTIDLITIRGLLRRDK